MLHFIDTLAYSIRLNAVKNGQFALSTSLFNTISLVTRVSSTLFLPAIGALVDHSIQYHIDPIWQLRQILFGATIGACVGAVFIPTFLRIFGKAVNRLEIVGSVPALMLQALSIANIRRIRNSTTVPRRTLLAGLRFRQIPKRLLLVNIMITAVYTVGVLASNYSALLNPQHRLEVAQSSGFINSVGTILLTMLVDPKSASITDQALRGTRPYGDVKALVTLLVLTKILGTILAQFIFTPSAHLIAWIYR
ncbi:lipid II flippase Amj family protein [Alicyclobacillus dauci]|uniref:Lipid II flippase Amj n=1 Tax=Alicyclobacillus dauci TaxID=1475485 RepID=A0ABY6Z0K2_9BACL|nr:lipid II flippase Amj family protein [Alicyclobacillus dauci]WAH36063.1 lipid II flippase Amj family protein [Alicyclobacillus dauci]